MLQLLASDGDVKPLAGGQSLVPMLNFRLARTGRLVDLSRLAALNGVLQTDDHVTLGALTTHAALEDGAVPGPAGDLLIDMARQLAYRPVRNRGTIGGSLAHADPRAEWPLAMAALDAQLVVRRAGGERVIAARDFMTGPYSTELEDDELIESLTFRTHQESQFGYCKLATKAGEFAEAMAIVRISTATSIQPAQVEAWLGAPSDRPVRIDLDAAADGAATTVAGRHGGTALAAGGAKGISDLRGEIDRSMQHNNDPYARQLASVAVERALRAARASIAAPTPKPTSSTETEVTR